MVSKPSTFLSNLRTALCVVHPKGLDSILKVKVVTMVNGYRGLGDHTGSIKLNNRYKRLKHVNLSENEAVTPTTYHQNGVLMKGCINLLSVKRVF